MPVPIVPEMMPVPEPVRVRFCEPEKLAPAKLTGVLLVKFWLALPARVTLPYV